MPVRHRADFKEALSTLRRLKECKGSSSLPKGGKALPLRGGNDKIPSHILHLRHHHDDGIERGNLRKSVDRLFTCGMSFTMNLVNKLQ